MKLWKGATFAFVLCGAALTIVLIRNMTVGHLRPKTKNSHTSSSSSRQSSASESATHYLSPEGAEAAAAAAAAESSQHTGGLHRRVRSADQMTSLLSECKINC